PQNFYILQRLHFADCDQSDFFRISSCFPAGVFYVFLNLCQIILQHVSIPPFSVRLHFRRTVFSAAITRLTAFSRLPSSNICADSPEWCHCSESPCRKSPHRCHPEK